VNPTLAATFLFAAAATLQSQPAFEVASIKRNTSGDTLRAPSLILPGGRFTATNNTVRALILNAYGISGSPYLLSGGPGWIDSERYDVDAKAEAGAIPATAPNKVLWDTTRSMLRSLLAERFKLAIRRGTKEMPVYELVVAKNGSRLQKSSKDCDAGASGCHGFSGNPLRMTGSSVDIFDLTLMLRVYAERPVLDRTGLQGVFDLKLQWNPFVLGAPPAESSQRAPGAEAREGPVPDRDSLPSLFTALEQQLGLKLEARKGTVEIYVIERVERPSEN
jgi:bla regulator protein BlaR1